MSRREMSTSSATRWLGIGIVTCGVVAACGGGSPSTNPVAPTEPISTTLGVIVLPTLLGVGETGQAHAVTTANADVSTQTSWTSSSPAFATITSAGIVTAIASGTTSIGGRYQNF